MVRKAESIEAYFYALSLTVNYQPHIYTKRSPGSEFTAPKMGGTAMVGIIPGSTIRGWLRSGINNLLIDHGIMGIHPMSKISISKNNDELFDQDLRAGYFPRDEQGLEKHPVYQLFGDIGRMGNLGVSSVYFYPTETGTPIKKLKAAFTDRIGSGFIELGFHAPSSTSDSSKKFLKTELLRFRMVQAPIIFDFWKKKVSHRTLVLMALDYLNRKVQQRNFNFLMGGERRNGSGEVRIQVTDKFDKRSNNTLGLNKSQFETLEKDFDELTKQLVEYYPIGIF
jgi:CRISPR/Cas system CSM-associated protein Csm3 (group 7 of RAMP superfamily)